LTALALPPTDVAPMLRDWVRDRSYVHRSGLGADVDRYLRWFRTEWGATPETIRSYEYTLARLALFHADHKLADFEPPLGTDWLREFWNHYWPADKTEEANEATAKTRQCKLAHLRSFFKWAVEERLIYGNPTLPIRAPRGRGAERHAHLPNLLRLIIAAQERHDDRIAIQLMCRMGFRRNELRVMQFRHHDPFAGTIVVFGKGGTVLTLPLFSDLHEDLLRLRAERQPAPDEFLLYPVKIAPKGRYPDTRMEVVWENRLKPLSLSGIDKWWHRCLDRAGTKHFPMHECRHSTATNFYRESRDALMTQRLMRHKSLKATEVYLHMVQSDLALSMDAMEAWE